MSDRLFNWSPAPDYTASLAERMLSAQFGDGYSQDVPDGINFALRSWPLVFSGPAERANEIEAFLNDHLGGATFLWIVPETGKQIRVRAKPGSRSRRTITRTVASISVTFEERPA